MTKFFINNIINNSYILSGMNATHIIKSLRMKVREYIILCDSNQVDHFCVITKIENGKVFLDVVKNQKCENEPSVKVKLYQALPKSDKMDIIIQKSVELGISEIIPIITERCISRPDSKSLGKKLLRWQKISEEAAKQSQRGIIPCIKDVMSLKSSAKKSCEDEVSLVFYELGGKPLSSLINSRLNEISFFVGPEGGFNQNEIFILNNFGVKCATLGKRILRTETVSIAALSIIMNLTNNI